MDNNYKIVRKIGQGSYGHVFLVKNSRDQTFVIKNVPINEPSKYTLNEFYVMRNLNHPRIVKLVEFYPSSNAYNFVLEYAVNGSLRDLIFKYQLNKWKLSNGNLIKLFTDIAYGVQYLHSKKIIHRDMKPENILVDENYRLKLADFGISKVVGDVNPQYQTSIGTLSYMSPEVYMHQPYDMSCDVWALGLILYELAFMKYFLTREAKVHIMNFSSSYKCPKADWPSRNYHPKFQGLLEMMVQRNPKSRSNIDEVCRHSLLCLAYEICTKEVLKANLKCAGNKLKLENMDLKRVK